MADLKCRCSLPYAPGSYVIPCSESSCIKCCPRTLIEEVDRFGNNNPTDPRSFGFNNKFDGRVRGGVKTPQAFDKRNSIVGREFNIFDSNVRQNQGVNVNPNRNRSQGRLVRLHPLDLLKQPRKIGSTIFDPVSRKWKVDDGRPRGVFEDGSGGRNWACWGKCKDKERRGWFGESGTVKCDCDPSADKCRCSGCMDSSPC